MGSRIGDMESGGVRVEGVGSKAGQYDTRLTILVFYFLVEIKNVRILIAGWVLNRASGCHLIGIVLKKILDTLEPDCGWRVGIDPGPENQVFKVGIKW